MSETIILITGILGGGGLTFLTWWLNMRFRNLRNAVHATPKLQAPLKGGNLTFQTGSGQRLGTPPLIGENGDFIFRLGGGTDAIEMLRVCGDGRVLVRGVQVDDDIEFYHEFRDWLGYARAGRTR